MKKSLLILAACSLAAAVPAAAAANVPAGVKIGKTWVYQPQWYSFAQAATIYNAQNEYKFIIAQSKPVRGNPPRTSFWLSAGQFGFCPLVNFLEIMVNGISYAKITPRVEDIVPWKEGDLAGCEAKFNFDGARIILRFHMRPDSPVLWASLRPAPDCLTPVKSVKVSFCAVVSALPKKDDKVQFSGPYSREAVTPARTLKQQNAPWALTPEDSYIVLQDETFDGSDETKGQGPVMILLDHESIGKATLFLRNSWAVSVAVELKEDFREFEFGLWQQEPRISNAAFAEKLKSEKAAFTR